MVIPFYKYDFKTSVFHQSLLSEEIIIDFSFEKSVFIWKYIYFLKFSLKKYNLFMLKFFYNKRHKQHIDITAQILKETQKQKHKKMQNEQNTLTKNYTKNTN